MNNSNQINEAILALSDMLRALLQNQERITQNLAALARTRQQYLSETVEGLYLPEISSHVLSVLVRDLPEFVTPVVRRTFSESHKFLGVFKSADYRHALMLLRVQLASYLDNLKYGRLDAIDTEIAVLNLGLAEGNAAGQQARELVRLLQQAAQRNLVLPPDVMAQVRRVVQRARTNRAAGQALTYSATSPSDGDADGAPYLLADNLGNSDDSDSLIGMLVGLIAGRVDDERESSGAQPHSGKQDWVPGENTAAAVVIATDDRAGRFS